MRIYIAGKITGTPPEICKAKFQGAEDRLKNMDLRGLEVVNPVKLVGNPQAGWNVAMVQCFAALIQCDAIYLLNDWKDSKGARIEFEVAKELDLKMFFESKIYNKAIKLLHKHDFTKKAEDINIFCKKIQI